MKVMAFYVKLGALFLKQARAQNVFLLLDLWSPPC